METPCVRDNTKRLRRGVMSEVDVKRQDHYTKWKIQPAKYIVENNMDYAQGCAIKYLTRFRDKGKPVEDLKKAIHYIEMLLQMEENGSVEL